MALKRKASFMASSSATPSLPRTVTMLDDTPKHLHSRTRKRFRDDRPDEQTVYANTLRWLFSAQQKQVAAPSEDESMSPPPFEPEPIDSRQQTLHKFFQSAQGSSSSAQAGFASQKAENPSSVQGNIINAHAVEGDLVMSSDESGSGTPSSEMMDVEMDTQMDCEGVRMASEERRWVGGIGWM